MAAAKANVPTANLLPQTYLLSLVSLFASLRWWWADSFRVRRDEARLIELENGHGLPTGVDLYSSDPSNCKRLYPQAAT